MRFLTDLLLRVLVRGEEGASFTEYGLLLVVVVLAVGAAAITLSDDIVDLLNRIGGELNTATIPDVP